MTFWRRLALAVLFPLLLHFTGTWALPLLDRDEPRFAEATREMRAGGDWLVPHFNQHYRFDKPPLTYWAQALSIQVFGESEAAVRLPSVVASALTSLVLFLWGRRVASEITGLNAALIFATALQVLIHSKQAVADSLLVLSITLGAWAGWEMMNQKRGTGGGRSLLFPGLFVAALALGFLAKGPLGWLPFGMIALFRFRRGPVNPAWPLAGWLFLLALALVALWGLPALLSTHGEYWREGIGRHVIARGFTTFEGHGGGGIGIYLALLPFYCVTVFASFFPWSIWLPGLIRQSWSRKETDALTGYLLGGVILVFGSFTFYKTRLPHYTLPAFPFLALLLAREWSRLGRSAHLLRRGVLGMTALLGLVIVLVFPVLRRTNPARQLLGQVAGALKPEMEFASVEYEEPSLVWYFRSRVNGYFSSLPAEEIPGYMAKPGPRFCVLPVAVANHLFPTLPPGLQQAGEFSGFNVVHGRRVDLRLIIKPD